MSDMHVWLVIWLLTGAIFGFWLGYLVGNRGWSRN
jgi:membrane protein DedA with SNARE-associated domain